MLLQHGRTGEGVRSMKRLRKMLKRIVRDICMTDRFLIVFMIVLFCYMAVRLFAGSGGSEDTNTINVIIRTSMASIFGYFISSNFSKSYEDTKARRKGSFRNETLPKTVDKGSSQTVQNRIGFQTASASADQASGGVSFSEYASSGSGQCSKVQIAIVAVIGLVSLVILLITGQFQDVTSEITAITSQLRDFVAASIGFLISCGKNTAD